MPIAPRYSTPAARMLARRRRAVVLFFLLLTVIVLVIGQAMRDETADAGAVPAPAPPRPAADRQEPAAAAVTTPARAAVPPDAADKAQSKPAAARFVFAGGHGPVLGSSGTLRRFRVAVEKRLASGDGGNFAEEIDRILGDPRSWIAGRQFRFQRVPGPAAAEFTVYLASAATSEKMCAEGGLRTEGFTSCRLPGQVVINNDRWQAAVPGYGAPLAAYRAYAINHEVGHQLGHGHEVCPGEGKLAPVMMQQTYGLKGCVPHPWPYVEGERYAGNPVG
ncbi:DUF3152 domain-containing protein [Actinoplanes sp. NPDC004185]